MLCLGFDIEEYPEHLSSIEKLNFKRTCAVQCDNCGKVIDKQEYDT
jgi:hypothetical protein